MSTHRLSLAAALVLLAHLGLAEPDVAQADEAELDALDARINAVRVSGVAGGPERLRVEALRDDVRRLRNFDRVLADVRAEAAEDRSALERARAEFGKEEAEYRATIEAWRAGFGRLVTEGERLAAEEAALEAEAARVKGDPPASLDARMQAHAVAVDAYRARQAEFNRTTVDRLEQVDSAARTAHQTSQRLEARGEAHAAFLGSFEAILRREAGRLRDAVGAAERDASEGDRAAPTVSGVFGDAARLRQRVDELRAQVSARREAGRLPAAVAASVDRRLAALGERLAAHVAADRAAEALRRDDERRADLEREMGEAFDAARGEAARAEAAAVQEARALAERERAILAPFSEARQGDDLPTSEAARLNRRLWEALPSLAAVRSEVLRHHEGSYRRAWRASTLASHRGAVASRLGPGVTLSAEDRAAARRALASLASEVDHLEGSLRRDLGRLGEDAAARPLVAFADAEAARAVPLAHDPADAPETVARLLQAVYRVTGVGGARSDVLDEAALGAAHELLFRYRRSPLRVYQVPGRTTDSVEWTAVSFDWAAKTGLRSFRVWIPLPRPKSQLRLRHDVSVGSIRG